MSKETYVYLELNGILDTSFFQNDNVFFKMINIDGKPFVQIGNYVFEGKYEDHLGTKVFFVENKDYKSDDNCFAKQASIHLKYMAKTAKVMQLKWKKIPENAVHLNMDMEERLDVKFTETCAVALEKFGRGALNIQDIACPINSDKNEEEKSCNVEDLSETEENQIEDVAEHIKDVSNDKSQAKQVTSNALLKEFINLPKKIHEDQKVLEVNNDHLTNVNDAENFTKLKQLFLQEVLVDVQLEDNFEKYVSVEKSIEDGVIPKTNLGDLTEEQKNTLLKGSNFNNFTLPMKMTYLIVQIEEYKKILSDTTEVKNLEVDKYGRTLQDKYCLLKYLVKDMWYYIYSSDNLCS